MALCLKCLLMKARQSLLKKSLHALRQVVPQLHLPLRQLLPLSQMMPTLTP